MVNKLEVEGLLSALFSGSKWRWGSGVALEASAVLGGALSVLLDVTNPWAGILTTSVAVAGSLLRWWGDIRRGHAEQLLRAKEFRDGMGWEIDAKLFADLRERYSSLKKSAARRQEEQSDFYDTDEKPGPQRLLEMLRESTWWSERLARFTFRLCLVMVIILVVASLYAGIPLVRAATGSAETVQLAGLYTALICLLFSGDLGRLVVSYAGFASGARDAYFQLNAVAGYAQPLSDTVLSSVMEYQFVRSAAPPIPDWVWRMRRGTLNETWDDELSSRQ